MKNGEDYVRDVFRRRGVNFEQFSSSKSRLQWDEEVVFKGKQQTILEIRPSPSSSQYSFSASIC